MVTQSAVKVRLLYLTTDPAAARYLMRGQLRCMSARGFDVTVVSAPGRDLDEVAAREGVRTVAVAMHREIAPLADLRSLIQLNRVIRRLRPDVINAGTPKAAFLGMIAAAVNRVPVRVYTLRGLRAETARHAKRLLLETLERLTAALAHRVVCVSDSLREEFLRRGLCRPEKMVVLREGSSNGVEAQRFRLDSAARADIRTRLHVPAEALVIGFVGRLTRDKGIVELLDAFMQIRARHDGVWLILVGALEKGDPIPAETRRGVATTSGVVHVDHVTESAPYYSAFDIVAFPSYREGFPNVPLEAAAAGLPVVGFRATGTVDAVQDGLTGTLVPRGDSAALAAGLLRYVEDEDLRRHHGASGRLRVESSFRPEVIWGELATLYEQELRSRGLRGLQ